MVVVLPEPFGPEQPEDLAAADFQVQGLQGPDLLPPPEIAINLGETSGFDDDFRFRCHGQPFRDTRIHPRSRNNGGTTLRVLLRCRFPIGSSILYYKSTEIAIQATTRRPGAGGV